MRCARKKEFRSEEHTSELQSHGLSSYAVFCLKKKKLFVIPHVLLGARAVEEQDVCRNAGVRRKDAVCFFFNDTATTEIYTRPYTLSLHDALPICARFCFSRLPSAGSGAHRDRLRSEEHTSELQSHGLISYAVFCLKKKK